MSIFSYFASGSPDGWAKAAASASMSGCHDIAFIYSVRSVRARAEYVLVNGKWVPRKGVMR